ncbi:MAG: dihydroorotate dehydrogenase (quinone), partial [Acidocella sp.]|nr:dihydroorotate dehydrogenase (quinone) [Acidocella sp.]
MTPALASALVPLLRQIDPETAHRLSMYALRFGLAGHDATGDDACLAVTAFGRSLRNPIGLAAGFDKNAVAVTALGRLGFGFIEAGTVTPRPQAGNPRPRLFRLMEDRAVINRMGFNNGGLEAYKRNLKAVGPHTAILGANVGINKDGANPER